MEAKAQKSGTKKARNRRKNSFSRPKAISKIILIALAALSIVAAVLYIFLGKPGKDEMEQVIDDGTILAGVTVKRATLNNFADYEKKGLRCCPALKRIFAAYTLQFRIQRTCGC